MQIDPAGDEVAAGAPIAATEAALDGAAALPFMPLEAETPVPGLGVAGPAGLLALARLARQAGDGDEALTRYREALILHPADAASAIEAALFQAERGELRDAVEILERCVRRHPELPAPRFHLGAFWRQLAEPAKADAQLRRYLALEPEDLLGAEATLASLEREPSSLPATFVRALFDQYADDFERNLVEDLDYRAPQVLRRAVDRVWQAPAGGAAVLDLGCGTGLGGAAFRDLARLMDGVDLSPRMIEKAAARNIYDRLEVGDAAAELAGAPGIWDLVLAADVLVYMGELEALFRSLARALRPGGAFAATAESAEGAQPVLKPTRRFGHPASYLRHVAATAGLRVALLEPAATRREKGEPVPGHAIVLVRDA